MAKNFEDFKRLYGVKEVVFITPSLSHLSNDN